MNASAETFARIDEIFWQSVFDLLHRRQGDRIAVPRELGVDGLTVGVYRGTNLAWYLLLSKFKTIPRWGIRIISDLIGWMHGPALSLVQQTHQVA